eukprot:891916-Rhodomonas_salina.1
MCVCVCVVSVCLSVLSVCRVCHTPLEQREGDHRALAGLQYRPCLPEPALRSFHRSLRQPSHGRSHHAVEHPALVFAPPIRKPQGCYGVVVRPVCQRCEAGAAMSASASERQQNHCRWNRSSIIPIGT